MKDVVSEPWLRAAYRALQSGPCMVWLLFCLNSPVCARSNIPTSVVVHAWHLSCAPHRCRRMPPIQPDHMASIFGGFSLQCLFSSPLFWFSVCMEGVLFPGPHYHLLFGIYFPCLQGLSWARGPGRADLKPVTARARLAQVFCKRYGTGPDGLRNLKL